MVAGARTFSLEDTFLEPQILNPPPTRHALFVLLLTLAAVLHIGTAGWGDLYDGVEGQFAGGAREMVESNQWLVPTNDGAPLPQTPPLVYWLIAGSFKIFGVTATAARLPIALAMVASVAFTFLIGERLAGYWRGFAAGLLHLCSCGAFVLGRMVTPDAIFAALIGGAIFCAVAGYQRRQFRRAWFAGFWLCGSFACLAKGLGTIFYLAGICVLLAIFFREARIRFSFLLHWSYLLLFLAIVAPWFVWTEMRFPGALLQSFRENNAGLPRIPFLFLHLLWWSPAMILLLSGLLFATRRIIRPHEITFADALPVCWMAAGFGLLLLVGERHPWSSLSVWPAVALGAACAWERAPRGLRLAGIALLILVGTALGATGTFAPDTFAFFSDLNWLELRPMVQLTALSLIILSLPTLYFVRRRRAEISLLLALAPMLPVGFCLMESASRVAPFFSLADPAQFLNPRLGTNGQVIYEGPLKSASSLTFYLNKKFFLVNQAPSRFEQSEADRNKYLDENFVLEAWSRADPIYFIIEERRVAYWRKLIMERVHIYHQVTTSGHYVILSNQL
jgi:4-amino-4-deoxy-L-arabinose transferase-like glycosyltransferase